ncbi:hypothetical protein B0H19DRAFT_1140608 [Mycena capillaripes]|nr:hypothetical protein B0H19DRAFT_1140608 [Mycena capillaripes]
MPSPRGFSSQFPKLAIVDAAINLRHAERALTGTWTAWCWYRLQMRSTRRNV